MIKSSPLIFTALFLASMFLSSCGSKDKTVISTKLAEENQKKEIQAVNPPPTEKPAGKYETKSFQKSYNDCKPGADSCTYIKVSYQLLNEGGQSIKINKAITDSITNYSFSFDKPFKSVDESMASFIKEYEGYIKDMKASGNGEYLMNWYFEEQGKVEYDNTSILSYSMSSESFTGGAHGSAYVNYYVFDLTTGSPLTYKDVFEKGSEKALDKLIEKKFRQTKGLTEKDNLIEQGGLFENHIEHNNNFAVFKDGIRFYYNSYEIAPYSSGPTELIVSWAELGDLVNKNLKK